MTAAGAISKDSLLASLMPLNVEVNEDEVLGMVNLAHMEGDQRLGLRQFVRLFADVQVSVLQRSGHSLRQAKNHIWGGRKHMGQRRQSLSNGERGTI